MALTKTDLLGAAGAAHIEAVDLPGRGTVYVRSVDGLTLDRMQQATEMKMRNGSLAATVVMYCACEADGKPLFSEDDFDAILRLGVDILTPLSEAAIKLNRIDKQSIEDTQKN